jgi:IS5 family transposase
MVDTIRLYPPAAERSDRTLTLKTRYRGLAKNRAQLFTLFAPGNLFLVRRRLLA